MGRNPEKAALVKEIPYEWRIQGLEGTCILQNFNLVNDKMRLTLSRPLRYNESND